MFPALAHPAHGSWRRTLVSTERGAVSVGATDTARSTPAPDHLRRGALGLWAVVFLVVASAAPLTSMLGAVAPPLAIGNGIGAPGTWLLTGIVLLLFAVGYAAMTRYVTNAGAFYAYIARGLGRPAGVGAALVAVLAYNVIQAALFGLFGFFAEPILEEKLGIAVTWEVWAFLALVLVAALGYLGIGVSARILGVLLIAEVLILMVLNVAILIDGGPDGLSLDSFAPGNVFDGSIGVAFIFAFATFVGFEATAIYGEETKDPHRTTPKATYIAVALITAFYTLTSWAIIQAYPGEGAVATAQDPEASGGLFFVPNSELVGELSTSVMEWLLITSIFAALLAFHNAAARYFFVMAREGLLPRGLARTHPRHGAPVAANVLQIVIVAVIVAAFALAGETRSCPCSAG
jgi:amino acid transporter